MCFYARFIIYLKKKRGITLKVNEKLLKTWL